MTMPRCILDGRFDLAESPVWSMAERCLWFVDINRPAVHRFDPASGRDDSWPVPSSVGCIARSADGGVIGALRDGIWRLDLAGGRHRLIAPAPYDQATTRFNDGRCDRQGRLWVGSMFEPRREPQGALYRLDGDHLVAQALAGGVSTSNALAWSPDGTIMYHADTNTHRVQAYDYDIRSGALSNRRDFLDLTASGERPDGATVDAAGNYWVAFYGAGKVAQFAPDGHRLREIALPLKSPTMPCFGGPELKTLYITTARQKYTAEELAAMPLAGGIFAIELDTPGLPEPFFAG